MSKLHEIWKDIPEYENLYQASSEGDIKSIQGKLNFYKHRKGYTFVEIFKGTKRKMHLKHIIIAKTFIPNPENKPQVNHKNGIKWDDRVVNLEWNTALENIRHRINILGIRTGGNIKKASDKNIEAV